MEHWADAYYGELYLDSVADLLTPALTALEAEAIAACLDLSPGARVLDLACGHGRHAWALAARGARVVGLDRNRAYLQRALGGDPTAISPASPLSPTLSPSRLGEREERQTATPATTRTAAATAPHYVRGDVRTLPFADGAFDALYSWYASLFMFDDPTNEACLAEAARVIRPGGRLVVHHANPMQLAAEPTAAARRKLADGSTVEERSSFDAARGVDRSTRRLVRPGGAVLAATAELRYYMPSEWRRLAARTRLLLVGLTSTPDAACAPRREPGPEAPDIIALLEKPT